MDTGKLFLAGSDVFNRRVLLTFVDELLDLQSIEVEGKMVLVVVADTRGSRDDELAVTAAKLLDNGAVYIFAWGPGSERFQKFLDDAVAERTTSPEAPAIITTSNPEDTLHTALSFVTKFAVPDEAFDDECRTIVVAVVADRDWYEEAREALRDVVAPAGSS